MHYSKKAILSLAVSGLVLSGCMNLAPGYERPAAPVPAGFQAELKSGLADVTTLNWEDVIVSEELKSLITLALSENRDLRMAASNIEIARLQYGISRAGRLPSVTVGGGVEFGDTIDETPAASNAYSNGASAQVSVSAFELDFFSRVRNLNASAFEAWLATIEGKRSAEITIAANVARAWIQLAADRALLQLAESTVETQTSSLNLTKEMMNAGVVSELDVRRASTSVSTAKAAAAQAKAAIRQDLNALRLLVGTNLPAGIAETATLSPSPVKLVAPENLSSDILFNRPDVLQAEHSLMASYADIGAARAAFYPTISLTGSLGAVSTDLGDLFDSTGSGWTFGPSISLPIFDAERRTNQLAISKESQKLALSTYELTIQTAFRETADALAVSETIGDRLAALTQLEEDTSVTLSLSRERFSVGVDDYLSVLDAQQSNFSARQNLISAKADQAANQITLFQALGVTVGSDEETP